MRAARQAIVACLLLLTCLGCGQRNEDFIPSEEAARRALEMYLTAWQRGEREQAVTGTSPQVVGADGLRLAGRSLEQFTVLGPTPGNAPRCFAVRLNLGNPKEEMRERYVVVGLDPLWVYRYPDYEVLTHWCPPLPSSTRSQQP